MSVCLSVCLSVYLSVYLTSRMCVCVRVWNGVIMSLCICSSDYLYVSCCTCIHLCVRACMRACVRTYVCVYVSVCVLESPLGWMPTLLGIYGPRSNGALLSSLNATRLSTTEPGAICTTWQVLMINSIVDRYLASKTFTYQLIVLLTACN